MVSSSSSSSSNSSSSSSFVTHFHCEFVTVIIVSVIIFIINRRFFSLAFHSNLTLKHSEYQCHAMVYFALRNILIHFPTINCSTKLVILTLLFWCTDLVIDNAAVVISSSLIYSSSDFFFIPYYLWLPCVADSDIIFLSCFFLSSSCFFPRLISVVADWISTILPHMVWP